MRFDSSRAIFLQIEDILRALILSGKYQEGQRIPSVREMAGQMEVNPNTMVRCYGDLQDQSLLENRRGVGYFVAPGALEKVRGLESKRIETEVLPQLVKQMKLVGMGLEIFEKIWNIEEGAKHEN